MSSQSERDAEQLRKLGYAQQLARGLGGFSNFALSFSVISILTGAVTLYDYGLQMGGPRVMSLGWPLVTLFTLAVAASLAQLASSFPTAGALYHWSAMLGGPGWGFFTAGLNTIGQFAITAAIDYGLAVFVHGMFGWKSDGWHPLPLCAAILVSQAVLNHVGVKALTILNWISAWHHLLGVVLFVGVLAVLAPHQPLGFTLRSFSAKGYSPLQGFALGLLQAAWTFTGYDASAHVSEETVDPSRAVPRGLLLSVAVSGVAGYALLIAVTLAIGDLQAVSSASSPFFYIMEHALPAPWGSALIWVAMAAMWFCGLASVTSNSRMLFAFARDGGLPASQVLARVSPRFKTPAVAVWVCAAAALAVAAWSSALSAMTALSTIALYASYGCPIFVGALARRSRRWSTRGPWDLGRYSPFVNALAVSWIAVVMVLFVLPPNQLAGWTFAGCGAVLALYWTLYLRGRFKGPPMAPASLAKES
jgi:amino acid transporter